MAEPKTFYEAMDELHAAFAELWKPIEALLQQHMITFGSWMLRRFPRFSRWLVRITER